LSDLREGRRTARQAIDTLVAQYRLPEREMPLTLELVHGVIRHRLTLATLLSPLTRNGWRNVGRQLQHVLMLGAYQLVWLDSVPPFAAVSEAVNQARAEGGEPAGRFVNAILRQLERNIEHRRLPAPQADPVRSVPVDRTQSCQFRLPVLADPEQRAIEFWSQATSHPSWLVSRWMDAYGPERTAAICRSGMLRPPVFVRPNPLRITPDALLARMAGDGLDPQAAASAGAIVVGNTAGLGRSPLLAEGLCQPQDPTAMLPVRRMALHQGQVAIDLCGGLGTKTTQMIEELADTGMVLATDIDAGRAGELRQTIARLGYASARVVDYDALPAEISRLDRLDWILIDAPCSNAGVLARRPEVRYRLSMPALTRLSETQLSLLGKAADAARAETRLMYSTCSIDPEENEAVCTRFLQDRPAWKLIDHGLTLPDPGSSACEWRDGGYWAILGRS
jgi:16S rRNA (cytosine967-C5)-methyltransferase